MRLKDSQKPQYLPAEIKINLKFWPNPANARIKQPDVWKFGFPLISL